jgi:ABC-2 type transport system permease protein
MTSPFPSLVRFYVRSVYGLSGAKRTAPGVKKTLKTAGIALLVLLVVADIGVIFVAMNLSMYEALKPAGLQGLLLLNAATSAALVVFVLGFVTALSTYCMSQAETALLALPIAPRALLGAKLIMVYLAEFALSFLLLAVAAVVYGINEAPPLSFYLYALLAALAMPLLPLAAVYIVLVPLMSVGRFLRNKNAVMLIGGLVGAAFAVAFNLYIQSATARMTDAAWILANYAGPEALLARIGSAYPPTWLAWKSLGGLGLPGLGFGLANLALGLGAAALAVFLLGPAYAASLLGFDEQRWKRLAETSPFIARTFKRSPRMRSLFLREWRLMNREPNYFLNGPFVVVLLPLILGVMYIAQRQTYVQLLEQLGAFRSGPGAMLAGAAFGAFLGSATSICCTALSRDAKALPYIKALPLPYADYMMAKFLHGFAFSLFGSLVGAVGIGFALSLPPLEIAGAFFIAIAFGALVDIAGLWIDTAMPKLSWDNPLSALKQNPNSIIIILGSMGLIATLGLLSSLLPLGKAGFVALYGGGCALLAVAAIAAYPRYAEKRIAELEA